VTPGSQPWHPPQGEAGPNDQSRRLSQTQPWRKARIGLAAAQAAREAAKETTPATVAQVGAVQQQVEKLKSAIHAITGKSPV
jgi:hypothetical protein